MHISPATMSSTALAMPVLFINRIKKTYLMIKPANNLLVSSNLVVMLLIPADVQQVNLIMSSMTVLLWSL